MCAAELGRIEGHPDPEASAAAAAIWTDLGQPYPAAYADWRHAEALLEQGDRSAAATGPLRRAHAAAVRIGSPRLVADVEQLARRAHVALDEPAGTVPQAAATPVDAFGLTKREREVLGLVSAGWTNREIGEALFISEKTASVHVSRILTKLGVRSRVEAAGLGHRLGLTDPGG
jgi:DNA-binding NarL/FixJ family response regulator